MTKQRERYLESKIEELNERLRAEASKANNREEIWKRQMDNLQIEAIEIEKFWKRKMYNLQISNDNLTEQLDDANNDIENLNKETEELTNERSVLIKENYQLQTELTNLQNQYQQEQELQQTSQEELQKQKNILETKLKQTEQEAESLRQKIDKLEKELEESKSNYQESQLRLVNDNSFQERKSILSKPENDLFQLKEQLKAKEQKILGLKKDLLVKNDELKRIRLQKKLKISRLKTEKKKLELDFDYFKQNLANQEVELGKKQEDLKNVIELEPTRIVRNDKSKLEREVKNLKDEIQNLKNKVEQNTTQKEQINIDIQKLQTENQIKPTLMWSIGKGGYGEVYYGEWKMQEVAIKKLYLSNISESDLNSIKREIEILQSLRNRYIIQYYDIYLDDQELLIIMDYAENGSLTKYINDNKNQDHNWNFNTNLIRQIARGLAFIHLENITHRDLKSMNILLTKNYEVKIADFGLSKVKNISSWQSRQVAKGTLGWMAPELLRDINNPQYSEQSDVYALGMVIWELVAQCTQPFKDIEYSLISHHIINNKGRETIPTNTPQNIQEIIQSCWVDNPQERISLTNILKILKRIESDVEYQSNQTQVEMSPKK